MRELTDIPLPAVTRVHTEDERLAWHAAVVTFDSGVPIRLFHYGAPARYSINVGNSSIGGYSFRDAWTFLTGVCTGATQTKVVTQGVTP